MDVPSKDPWKQLTQFTNARIALGKAGGSLPTDSLLKFRRDHAMARESVLREWDVESYQQTLEKLGFPSILLQSQVRDKKMYLQRPDLGRELNIQSTKRLFSFKPVGFTIGIVLSEGLSAWAINRHAAPLLTEFLPLVAHYSLAPIALAKYGRVAIGDEIGELLKCKLVIVFIGERPGLSTKDSMGIYLTYNPMRGTTDEKRNCISNIHSSGLKYSEAAIRLHELCEAAFQRKITGIELKEGNSLNIE